MPWDFRRGLTFIKKLLNFVYQIALILKDNALKLCLWEYLYIWPYNSMSELFQWILTPKRF